MSEIVDVKTLRTIPFLEELPEQELQELSNLAKIEDYPPDSQIFMEGVRERRIFMILKGLVALELKSPKGGNACIQTVRKGELLGWSPMLNQLPMTATARTLHDTRVVSIDAPELLAACQTDPALGFAIMRKTAQALSRRLSATRQHMLHAHFHNAPLLPADLFEGAD